jgi:hypothetical protein
MKTYVYTKTLYLIIHNSITYNSQELKYDNCLSTYE